MSKSAAIYHLRLSEEDLAHASITLWQGALGFTDREVELLALIAIRHKHLAETVADEELAAELLLSAGFRTELREKLNASANNLQNYVKSLREKGALLPTSGGDKLSPKLHLKESITFTFTKEDG